MRIPDFWNGLGLFIGLAGLVFGFIPYADQRPQQEVSYVGATRYVLSRNEWGITASYNGAQLKGDVYESRILIRNSGSTTLSPDNLRESQSIAVSFPGTILSEKEISEPGVVSPKYKAVGSFSEISFTKFDPGAEISITALTVLEGTPIGDPVLNVFGVGGNNIGYQAWRYQGWLRSSIDGVVFILLSFVLATSVFTTLSVARAPTRTRQHIIHGVGSFLLSITMSSVFVINAKIGDLAVHSISRQLGTTDMKEFSESLDGFRSNKIPSPF